MARTRKYRWRRVILPICALTSAWLVGLFLFVGHIPVDPSSRDPSVRTDAIVVLTGGPGRVAHGTMLLASQAGQWMLISGVGTNVAERDLIPANRLTAEILKCCVTLGRAARNTRENAMETAGWVAANGAASLRLVTADFHMPRSLIEFRAHLPRVEIIPDPVTSENVRFDQWWRWPGTAFLLAGEYNKFLAARARIFLT